MKKYKGIKIIDEIIGNGSPVNNNDYVEYTLKMQLNKGEYIKWSQPQKITASMDTIMDCNGNVIGQSEIVMGISEPREIIEISNKGFVSRNDMFHGLRYSIIGMRENGFRKVKVAPHLIYAGRGIKGSIPENAVLLLYIHLAKIIKRAQQGDAPEPVSDLLLR